MKWYKYICIAILAAVCVVACKKEEDDPIPVPPSYEASDQTIGTSYKYADIHWVVETSVTINEMWIEYTPDSAFAKFEKAEVTVETAPENGLTYCAVVLNDLTENTLYYARFRVVNKTGSAVLNTFTFKTKAYEVPQIRLDSVTELAETWCKVHATLLDPGMDTVPQEIGFCFAEHKDVSIEDTAIVAFENPDEPDYAFYWTVLQYLKDSTTYYVRAYAKNKVGVGYSEEVSFTTKPFTPPTLAPVDIWDVSYTSATVSSDIVHSGGLSIPETGFYYSTDKDPVKNGTKVAVSYGEQPFGYTLTELMAGTTYYVCAYAVNDRGTGYSEVATFKTVEFGMPVVTTGEITSITTTEAYMGGSVLEDGGDEITDRGICYGLKANPGFEDNIVQCGTGLGAFGQTVTGLQEGTTYHVRAYATNSKGTTFGEDKTFTTLTLLPPTVETGDVTQVDYTFAGCSGTVTATGGLEVTERGICYAKTANPTIYNMKEADINTGMGYYYLGMGDLQPGTTYYVRAYATNAKGTAYGEERTFTTKAYKLATFESAYEASVELTTATLCANISDDGGKGVNQRGFCYAAWNTTPDIENSSFTVVVDDGTGTGVYCDVLKDLLSGHTYYVRAFATNDVGTAYSELFTFTTLTSNVPVVGTSPVTDITTTSAVTGGNVISAGDAYVTERGVCYSTSPNPTIESNRVVNGSGTGSFVANLSNLTYNTTYYVRAYAKNSIGVGYGNELSFTTQDFYSFTIITYKAISKLPETTDYSSAGLHTNAFETPIISHEFADGEGTITFGGVMSMVGSYAFNGCNQMSEIKLPLEVNVIGDHAFMNCTWLSSIDFYEITAIGAYAFQNCTSLTSLNLPYNLSVISEGMCKGCTGLTGVAMWTTTAIGKDAFAGCSAMISVQLPGTVTNIGSGAFHSCSSVNYISCRAIHPPTCASDAFDDYTVPLHVLETSLSEYKNTVPWRNFQTINGNLEP